MLERLAAHDYSATIAQKMIVHNINKLQRTYDCPDTMLGPEDKYATIDLNVKMLKPIPMDVTLKARANVIYCSKRLGVSEGTLEDERGIKFMLMQQPYA